MSSAIADLTGDVIGLCGNGALARYPQGGGHLTERSGDRYASLVGVKDGLRTDWLELLDRQAGVVTRGQARSFGLNDKAVDRQLRSSRWRILHRGVYATFSGAPGRNAELWAAVLRAGAGAALSHYTAAELDGLANAQSSIIHLTVPHGRHPEPIQGALVHRSGWIAQATHPARIPPRTRVEETIIDLTQVSASLDDACGWMSRGVGRRLTTAMRLKSALDRRPKVRWRAELGRMLADIATGVHSLLEHRYIRDVERAHGLPTPSRQVRTILGSRSRYVDNLYAAAGLAVELDGQIAHAIETRWTDMHRDNAHATIGIVTLRYNWTDVTARPCLVAEEIARVLERRGSRVRLRRCGPDCALRAA